MHLSSLSLHDLLRRAGESLEMLMQKVPILWNDKLGVESSILWRIEPLREMGPSLRAGGRGSESVGRSKTTGSKKVTVPTSGNG